MASSQLRQGEGNAWGLPRRPPAKSELHSPFCLSSQDARDELLWSACLLLRRLLLVAWRLVFYCFNEDLSFFQGKT